jgi:hypothetical protein
VIFVACDKALKLFSLYKRASLKSEDSSLSGFFKDASSFLITDEEFKRKRLECDLSQKDSSVEAHLCAMRKGRFPSPFLSLVLRATGVKSFSGGRANSDRMSGGKSWAAFLKKADMRAYMLVSDNSALSQAT